MDETVTPFRIIARIYFLQVQAEIQTYLTWLSNVWKKVSLNKNRIESGRKTKTKVSISVKLV